MEMIIELQEVNRGVSVSINGVNIGIIHEVFSGTYSWHPAYDQDNILSIVNDNNIAEIMNKVSNYIFSRNGERLLINIPKIKEIISPEKLSSLGFSVNLQLGYLEKKYKKTADT